MAKLYLTPTFQLVAPNEKALIAVGDSWDWVQQKRLLVNVVEASLYHMKKEVIISKFSSHVSFLPALKCLRFVHNDIETLRELGHIIDSLGRFTSSIEHLIIMDNPICTSTTMLRHYACALFPSLKTFNDIEITVACRVKSVGIMAPILKLQDLASSQQLSSTSLLGAQGIDVSESNADSASSTRGTFRSKTGLSSKRPGASMSQRVSGMPSENYEATIEQLVRETSLSSTSTVEMKSKWEDALNRAIQHVVKETIFALAKL